MIEEYASVVLTEPLPSMKSAFSKSLRTPDGVSAPFDKGAGTGGQGQEGGDRGGHSLDDKGGGNHPLDIGGLARQRPGGFRLSRGAGLACVSRGSSGDADGTGRFASGGTRSPAGRQ